MIIGILLAAGKGKRFGGEKLFERVGSEVVFTKSLRFLHAHARIEKIIIVASSLSKKKIQKLIGSEQFSKVKKIIIGGQTRYGSAHRGFAEAKKMKPDFVVIHNAANPCATNEDIDRCLAALKRNKNISGVAAGRPILSTIKKATGMRRGPSAALVESTLPRENLWEVETPQVVRCKDFFAACKKFPVQRFDFTDDLSVLEAGGYKTALVTAAPYNRKITTPEDLEILRAVAGDLSKEYAVGIGEDSHRFKGQMPSTKSLILGGIKVPGAPPLEADSDGDVILHALCNAIASAIGEGSLGTYATKMCAAGEKDSRVYLNHILKKIRQRGFALRGASISVEAARPKIDPLIPALKKSLSALLKLPEMRIGITATSGEKLSPFGRGKGIRCTALIQAASI